jgi:hypothetical protein
MSLGREPAIHVFPVSRLAFGKPFDRRLAQMGEDGPGEFRCLGDVGVDTVVSRSLFSEMKSRMPLRRARPDSVGTRGGQPPWVPRPVSQR